MAENPVPILDLHTVANQPDLATWTVALPGDLQGQLRPLGRTDVAGLSRFLAGLSAQTRRNWERDGYDLDAAREMCEAVGRYDKLRLVVNGIGEGGEMVGLMEFSFDLTQSDVTRYRDYGVPLRAQTDCRFGPCLADEVQGRGWASALFPYVAETARRFGQRRIILWGGVHADNLQAIRFYQRVGFRRVGGFLREEGRRCLDMVLDL